MFHLLRRLWNAARAVLFQPAFQPGEAEAGELDLELGPLETFGAPEPGSDWQPLSRR